jgi:hypothetical protein
MPHVIAALGSYQFGEIAGLVVLGILLIALVRRAVTASKAHPHQPVSVEGPAHAMYEPPAPVATDLIHAAASSVAPVPAYAAAAAVASTPPSTTPAPRARRTSGGAGGYILASVAVTAALIAGIAHVSGQVGITDGPWDTQQGRDAHAGFMHGCESGGLASSSCACIFNRIRSRPPYDTPRGFITLAQPILQFQQTQNASAIPPAIIDAVRGCV